MAILTTRKQCKARVIAIFVGRGLAKDRKKVVEEVSEGLYSSASLTFGKGDGQEEPPELDEPCGRRIRLTLFLHCAPTVPKPISMATCHPCCQGDEEQLLEDRDVTKPPNASPHLLAPDGPWVKAGFRSTTTPYTTSGNKSLAAAAAGSAPSSRAQLIL
ncbi:hypothetical protein DUI87_20182 [Hirundo rustica rustica]|uniref:Uncharacterized protein n=1 Tax=Hirundo rustica rustica TaxID=333673 RepID=A0A3M0JQ76_HIRRU|nr:hypothetical protein DUI87_20182 [Hirundo rustica rustica]